MKRIAALTLRYLRNVARPYLQVHGLVGTSSVFGQSLVVYEPQAVNVLVVAPHMDDETLGCGGALRKHATAGARITVVYLSDGAKGSRSLAGLHGDDLLRKKLELVAERKREARQACDLLGVERIAFLDAPDGKLNSSPGLVPKLRDVLLETRPEIVYVPFFLDAHPDHRAASCWFLEASRAAGLDPLCMAYEVWTPLAPTCIVPIDEVMEVKRRAIRCYASQLAGNDYEHKIAGLNAYRAMMLESRDARFAECYFSGPVASYRRLYEAYCKGNGPA